MAYTYIYIITYTEWPNVFFGFPANGWSSEREIAVIHPLRYMYAYYAAASSSEL